METKEEKCRARGREASLVIRIDRLKHKDTASWVEHCVVLKLLEPDRQTS